MIPEGCADQIGMEVSQVSSLVTNAAAGGMVEQASLYAIKKSLDTAQAQSAALIQMMEQAAIAPAEIRLLDLYA